jgi:hypothetical protein
MAVSLNQKEDLKPTKWEVVYEDEDSISIWKYNSKITTAGPVEVEYKWKRHFNPWNQKKKTLGELAKEEKKRKGFVWIFLRLPSSFSILSVVLSFFHAILPE